MSLDIKNRPFRYDQVLGQAAIITVLKQFVASGRGFQQSYLFCGGRGQGKTTLGRILARALLCEHSVDGVPCDQCVSCLTMLKDGSSVDYTEVDAATNSGKADVDRIKADLQYSSFSGRQHIYLFDEAHQLSTDALDALLKPLEDNIPGSENKRLVCIFCTTEPEKMRATVLSRCAPAFVIETLPPEAIAQHLARICDEEHIAYELDALQLVAEITECHIRDALKAVEGVSMLGPVNKANVAVYLHLDLNTIYLDILGALGQDLPRVLDLTRQAMQRVSPSTCYERLADAAMASFRVFLGVKDTSYWPADRLQALSSLGPTLLGYVDRLSSRPGKPTGAMLLCDLALLHHGAGADRSTPVVFQVVAPPTVAYPAPRLTPENPPTPPTLAIPTPEVVKPSVPAVSGGRMENALTDDPGSALYVNPKARAAEAKPGGAAAPKKAHEFDLEPEVFCRLLSLSLAELRSQRLGQAR